METTMIETAAGAESIRGGSRMPVTVIQDGRRWIAKCDYNERHIPKQAGFRWDLMQKHWYTTDESIAKLLTDPDAAAKHDASVAARKAAAAIEASRAATSEATLPVPDGLAYLPYQRAGIATAVSRPNVLLGDEMGLGKTIQAIGVINADESLKRILIVCPSSLRLNWRNELRRWLVRPMEIQIAEGSACKPEWGNVLIINYDIADRHKEALRSVAWDLLIADEAHYMKNPDAKRTQAVLGHAGKRGKEPVPGINARRKVFLTGTPIPNRPVEGWPLFSALGAFRPDEFFRYAKRYCAAYQGGHGWDFSGHSNLDELQNHLRATIMIRRLKADVLTELPPKRRQVIEIPANGAAAAVEAEKRCAEQHEEELERLRALVELAKAGPEADYDAAVQKLRQAARVAFTDLSKRRHETAVAKIPYVIAHLRDAIESGQKVVCFAHHKDVIDALRHEFGGACVKVTGDDAMQARQDAVESFQRDPGTRLFLGNIQAAGVGLTLTAAAWVVFAELDWVPGNVTQAEDRCHRIGQRESVLVQHLVLEGSLDARMVRVLIGKQEVIEQALDRPTGHTETEEEAASMTALQAECRAGDVSELDEEIEQQAPQRRERPATARLTRKVVEEEAASMTPDQIEAIHRCMMTLASMDMDHAAELNGMGFSKSDSYLGHDLAGMVSLSARHAVLGRKLVQRYRRQLDPLRVSIALGAQQQGFPENSRGS